MPEYKLKHFQPVSAPADVVLSQRWLVENISRSLPGVRGVRFELELELELENTQRCGSDLTTNCQTSVRSQIKLALDRLQRIPVHNTCARCMHALNSGYRLWVLMLRAGTDAKWKSYLRAFV